MLCQLKIRFSSSPFCQSVKHFLISLFWDRCLKICISYNSSILIQLLQFQKKYLISILSYNLLSVDCLFRQNEKEFMVIYNYKWCMGQILKLIFLYRPIVNHNSIFTNVLYPEFSNFTTEEYFSLYFWNSWRNQFDKLCIWR